MSRISLPRGAAAVLLVALASACARASGPGIESALPVLPGSPWDGAHEALARLDPHLRDASAVGARASTAKTEVVIAGVRFEEVMITAKADLPRVRSVSLAAAPPRDGCEHVREELVKALGPAWNVGETRLGATTARHDGQVARIVCNGAELSLTIAG
ncbi:hypothetical protein [Anaeromyxobacter sp. Fw109-5]|uniref:hypothetical protein n=1 Tax=Anaeromyxobacter sp. (strain Fw109-5) TaxID=404589 RepID=UPI0000ED702E|nr:hypothetical protein [Anaeromyxobacter sp. Fw109-5]ABS27616.1 conserved hypothetical protein [Anaeromyxobacter sp. Fw109-5]